MVLGEVGIFSLVNPNMACLFQSQKPSKNVICTNGQKKV